MYGNTSSDIIKVVCLAAREPGIALLEYLIAHPSFAVQGIFTHSLLPSSEDPLRGQRPLFTAYQRIAQKHSIPLFIIDYVKDAKTMYRIDSIPEYDYLISLNWKFLVPAHILGKSRIADINLHRGKLPEYKGLEPIKRMLCDGLDYVTITTHIMDEEYDSGTILHEYNHLAHIKENETLEEAISRLKKELVPHYPQCAIHAINKIRTQLLNQKALQYERENIYHS
ncbi:hypothetical protein KDK77_10365 [bacterium]|nr:hypothetical protein [bacterium]MCP5462927.1 hypothetical protein [bacterium]